MSRYSTDTRTIRPGEAYVAIRGERYDGHAFVQEAIRKGACALIVEQPVAAPPQVAVIQVEDSVMYLARMARRKLADLGPTVIGITGSVGKTSTKNAIATVLRGRYPVLSTQGNLNTVQGIALTLLNNEFGPDTQVVLEMGACKAGDIAELCRYFPPDIAVVTNVHGVHLETFGTIEDVARTKSEIVRALRPGGVACLNTDDRRVAAMAALSIGRTVRFGTGAGCDIGPHLVTVPVPLLGEHVVYLALAAFAVGYVLEMPLEEINGQLATLQPEKGRLSRLPGKGGCTLIDDSYNASPASTRAALGVLKRHTAARRIACLGDMLELGTQSFAEHVSIIHAAAEAADDVILVGKLMDSALATLPEAQARAIRLFSTSEEAAAALAAAVACTLGPQDVVLIKGSQGIRMEHISRALLREDIAPESVLCRQSKSWRQI